MAAHYGDDDGDGDGDADRSPVEANGFVRVDIDVADHGQGGSGAVRESTPLLERRDTDELSAATAGSGSSVRSIRVLPGMKVRSHAIEPDGTLRDCTSSEALRGALTGKGRGSRTTADDDGDVRRGHYWIDVDADERDADELRSWLGQLRLPRFFLSLLSEPSGTWASQVVPSAAGCQPALLAVVRFLPEKETSDEMAHLAALSVPNLLLTFTSCPKSETGDLYRTVHRHMHDRAMVPEPSSSGALLAWLRFHLDRTSRSTRALRRTVLELDEAMDRDVTSVGLTEIIEAKDQLLRLLSVAEEQNEVLESLAGAEAGTDAVEFANLRGALSVLLATAGATERLALRVEKQVGDLRQRYEGHQQERINRRLAVLTVLSAVFLPLTLVTGIWGMNFEYMPELTKQGAYPLALLGMFTVAMSMICYFWRTGWFD